MSSDVKAELASEILDYIWNKNHWENETHSFIDEKGDVTYIEEAQNMYNDIYDIIDEVA